MGKEKFDKKLIKLLESNPDFVDEAGEFHRAKVRDSAWELNEALIKPTPTPNSATRLG